MLVPVANGYLTPDHKGSTMVLMATTYLTQQQYRNDKTRLTRAIRSGDPRKVIAVVEETLAAWDYGDFAWPDDWSRWERARQDADHAQRVAAW